MNDHGALVSALLVVFAVVAAVILILMATTAGLSYRHRRRRAEGLALRETLTMGDLVADEDLAAGFRSDAERRRRIATPAWRATARTRKPARPRRRRL